MTTRLLLALLALFIPGCASVKASFAPQESVAQVFARVHTSVVTLRTEGQGLTPLSMGQTVELGGNGSGVLINARGDILTAAHVVQAAEKIEVDFIDGSTIPAKVVSCDPITDVALLRLVAAPPEGILSATLGDSDTIRVGHPVFVVGSPLGIDHTLTVGYISALRLAPSLIDHEIPIEVLQTDAAINPGNSGGPIFNMDGQVVGIVSYISSMTGGNEGLGFAVSSNTCRERFLKLPAFWSGLEYLPVRGRLAQILNLPPDAGGYLVQRVTPGGPSEHFGLKGGDVPAVVYGMPMLLGGDIVLKVDDIAVAVPGSRDALLEHLSTRTDDDTLQITYMRAGEIIEQEGRWGDFK